MPDLYFNRFTAWVSLLLIPALLVVSGCGNDTPGDPISGPKIPSARGLGLGTGPDTDPTSWDAIPVLLHPEPWVVENAYIGPAMCGKCHAEIYADYLVSGHSQPFLSDDLSTSEVKSSPEYTDCGRCHTTGYDPIAETWEQDCVTCEACHGMGRIHSRTMAEEDIVIYRDEEFCWGCHDIPLHHPNSESGPTFRETSHPGGCGPCHDPHISVRLDPERAIVSDCIDCHTEKEALPRAGQRPHLWSAE
jgi:Cytochrome c554 and c-prime